MNETVSSIGQALQGPLGGVLALVGVGVGLVRGDLRLKREVLALQDQVERERQERQRWEQIAMDQLGLTDRVVGVAHAAVTAGRTP